MEYFVLLVVTKQVSFLPRWSIHNNAFLHLVTPACNMKLFFRAAISRAQADVNELNIGCDALSFCVNFIQDILVMLVLNIEWQLVISAQLVYRSNHNFNSQGMNADVHNMVVFFGLPKNEA
jgi:hypothetical protein